MFGRVRENQRGGNINNNNEILEDIELQQLSSFLGDDDLDLDSMTSNSGLSSVFEALNEVSEHQKRRESQLSEDNDHYQRDEDEDEDEAGNLLTLRLDYIRKSYAARKKCLLIFAVVFSVWLVALITYSHGGKPGYKSHKHGTVSDHNNGTTSHETPHHHKTGDKTSDSTKRDITLKDYRMGQFFVFNANVKFVGDDHYILKNYKSYSYQNFNNNEVSKILETLDFDYGENSYVVQDIDMSPKKDKILLTTDSESQWRHSSRSKYWIYDINTKLIEPLYTEDLKLNSAQWSPQGNYVSFVHDHNVYIKDINNSEIIKITEDGSTDIFNGKPDWVYEEEVLSSDNSLQWSLNESNLLYMTLNDSSVPVYNLEYFAQAGNERYPVIKPIKYPKPGFDNPRPILVNFNLAKREYTTLPQSEFGDEFIVYYMKFVNDDEIMIKETDRESNMMNVNIFNTKTNILQKVRQINAKDYGGWIEKPNPIVLVPHNGYIDTVVYENFNHLLYFENMNDSKPFRMLTMGEFDITGEYSYNLEADEVYIISTLAQDPLSHHLFKIPLSSGEMQNLTDVSQRGYYSINFNEDASHAVLNYRGPDIPFEKMVKLSDFEMEYYDSLPILNNNLLATAAQSKFDVPTTTFGNLTFDGLIFQYIEIKPLNFDPLKKYPLLVNIYGGPGSVKLSSAYGVGFEHVVSSSLDLIIIYLDPRGTGGKGWNFKKFAKGKIGYWEPRDITNISKILMLKKSYINKEKTAIWGWSYGGFTTLKTLEYDAGNVFKYGMAVAPVTNWLLYDSIYTERFMDRPENNADGYAESKINDIANFKKLKKFLIMHGTADDNVHLQNTLQLLDAFDLNGVENYDMHVFPDSDHGIYYHNANSIVYDKLFNWLKIAFQ